MVIIYWVCVNVEWLLHIHRSHCYMHASQEHFFNFRGESWASERAMKYIMYVVVKPNGFHVIFSARARAHSQSVCNTFFTSIEPAHLFWRSQNSPASCKQCIDFFTKLNGIHPKLSNRDECVRALRPQSADFWEKSLTLRRAQA